MWSVTVSSLILVEYPFGSACAAVHLGSAVAVWNGPNKYKRLVAADFGLQKGIQWKPGGQRGCLPSVLKMQSHAI